MTRDSSFEVNNSFLNIQAPQVACPDAVCMLHLLLEMEDVMKPRTSSKSDRLDIRITPEARRLLQEAARERHTTISQFVLESALNSASTLLAERSRLGLIA